MIYCDIELTERCNLSCLYCFLDNNKKYNITYSELEKRINYIIHRAEILKQDDIVVEFSGGEPLLEFDKIKFAVDYIESLIKDIDVGYSFVTNGILFNQEVAEFCSKNNFTIGISIDGNKYYHDSNRKLQEKGSYDSVISNHKNIKLYELLTGRFVTAHMVISKSNYFDFYTCFKHNIDLGFKRIDTSLDFTTDWDEYELHVLENELRKCFLLYYNLLKKDRIYYWKFVENGMNSILNPKKHYFCGGGIIQFTIKVNGKILSCGVCQKNPDAIIGDINNGINEQRVCKYGKYNRKLNKICANCDFQNNCYVPDCIFFNKEVTGTEHGIPDFLCSLYKINSKLCKEILVSMGDEIETKKR